MAARKLQQEELGNITDPTEYKTGTLEELRDIQEKNRKEREEEEKEEVERVVDEEGFRNAKSFEDIIQLYLDYLSVTPVRRASDGKIINSVPTYLGALNEDTKAQLDKVRALNQAGFWTLDSQDGEASIYGEEEGSKQRSYMAGYMKPELFYFMENWCSRVDGLIVLWSRVAKCTRKKSNTDKCTSFPVTIEFNSSKKYYNAFTNIPSKCMMFELGPEDISQDLLEELVDTLFHVEFVDSKWNRSDWLVDQLLLGLRAYAITKRFPRLSVVQSIDRRPILPISTNLLTVLRPIPLQPSNFEELVYSRFEAPKDAEFREIATELGFWLVGADGLFVASTDLVTKKRAFVNGFMPLWLAQACFIRFMTRDFLWAAYHSVSECSKLKLCNEYIPFEEGTRCSPNLNNACVLIKDQSLCEYTCRGSAFTDNVHFMIMDTVWNRHTYLLPTIKEVLQESIRESSRVGFTGLKKKKHRKQEEEEEKEND